MIQQLGLMTSTFNHSIENSGPFCNLLRALTHSNLTFLL